MYKHISNGTYVVVVVVGAAVSVPEVPVQKGLCMNIWLSYALDDDGPARTLTLSKHL